MTAGGPGNRDAASVTGPGSEILADTGRAAHNRAVHGRLAAGAFVLLLVSAVTACTSGAPSTQPGERATATASAESPARAGQALGASGCHPASPVTLWQSFLPQVEGTGHGATLWGLLMFPHALPARVGDQEKIVWRMTGTGMLTLQAIDPDGRHHQLAWGPDAHLSSNWDKPGDEWGAGPSAVTLPPMPGSASWPDEPRSRKLRGPGGARRAHAEQAWACPLSLLPGTAVVSEVKRASTTSPTSPAR